MNRACRRHRWLCDLTGALMLAAPFANAANFTVTSLADSGSGSLRDVVAAAASGDSITISATGTLTLTSGEIPVTKALTITGPGSSALTISGGGVSRIFKVSVTTSGAADAPLTLSGVTLANGYATGTCPAPSTGSGGAIAATESLSLTDVAITSSYAARNGGGLAWALRRSGQSLTMSNVRIVGNSAGCPSATAGGVGGGLFAGYDTSVTSSATGTLSLTSVSALGNSAQRHGGGAAFAGPLTISGSGTRFNGNMARTGHGGAIYLAAPSVSTVGTPGLSLATSELSNNIASLSGGAVAASNLASAQQASGSRASVSLTNSTVSGNLVQSASGNAAAASLAGNVSLTLNNCTVAQNDVAASSRGASIVRSRCTVTAEPLATLTSTIVAMTNSSNSAYNDLADDGSAFSNSWIANNSLVQRTNATLSGAGNLTSVDPLLAALAWNGGSTRSHALASSSPALNAGSNVLALSTDQRGQARVFGTAADIGAYEATLTATSAVGCGFDLDGDGSLLATTDGLMLARIMLGYGGDAVTSGAINTAGSRPDWASVKSYLNTNCGFSLP